MSSLQQIQLTYDQFQDRLVLTFSTSDYLEYRFWLTRRILKGFWDILQYLLSSSPSNDSKKQLDTQLVQEQIKQETQIAEANKYSTRLTKRPLSEDPLLLCKIAATPQEGDVVQFHLEGSEGRSVDFTGNSFLVASLVQLILKVLPKAEWNLETIKG
jgi:hypothetical protein